MIKKKNFLLVILGFGFFSFFLSKIALSATCGDGSCNGGEDISNCPQDCCTDASYLNANGFNPCDFKECIGITGVYGVPGLECGCDCDGSCCDDHSSCNPLEGSASCADCGGTNPACNCNNICETNPSIGISEFSVPACPDCGECSCLADDGCKKGCTPPDPDCQGCTQTLTTFEGGLSEIEIDLSTGVSEEAKIVLPMKSKICNAEVQAEASSELLEKRTPYIFVPLSATNRVVQIDTKTLEYKYVYGKHKIWKCVSNCDDPKWGTADWQVICDYDSNPSDTDCQYCEFSNPSRITVIPLKATWVANRSGDNVTALEIKDETTGLFRCQGVYSSPDGIAGARGVTFDVEGNIWVGGHGDGEVCKFKLDGTRLFCRTITKTYGMIGDSYGYVWIADNANDKVVWFNIYNCSAGSCPTSENSADPYGIGMDNEGDIWIGVPHGNKIRELDGADDDGGTMGSIVTECTGFSGCCTGIAVDGENNVWFNAHWDNDTWMIKGGDCSKRYSYNDHCSKPHGVAIDVQNRAWVVCRTGKISVLKYDESTDSLVMVKQFDLNDDVGSGTSNNASYNYSDMTGFRTPSLSLGIGFILYPGTGGTVQTFHFECPLYQALQECNCPGCRKVSGPIWGLDYCEIPLRVVSVFAQGKYTLKNLKIEYQAPSPTALVGGLVPCGRHTDDPTTFIDETQKCTFCHLLILGKRIADFTFLKILPSFLVLFLAISGFLMIIHRPSLARNLLKMFFIGAGIIFGIWFGIEILFFFLTPNPPFRDWTTAVCNVAPCDANGVCDTSKGETAQNCPSDCACNLAKSCGTSTKKCDFDGKCETDEEIDGSGGEPESCPDCAKCGDNVIDVGEECDGTSLPKDEKGNVITCKNYGYSGGTLSCTPNCKIDFNGCHY